MTHTNSWQPPSTTSFRCWPVFLCWLRLLFREERCCSFIFRVTLGHEPYCYCWQKSFLLATNFQENCLVFNTTNFTLHNKFLGFQKSEKFPNKFNPAIETTNGRVTVYQRDNTILSLPWLSPFSDTAWILCLHENISKCEWSSLVTSASWGNA